MVQETDLQAHHDDYGADLSRHAFFGTPGRIGRKSRKDILPVLPAGPDVETDIEDAEVVPVVRETTTAAEDYDTGSMIVSRAIDQEPVQILPHDSMRRRALIKNTSTSVVIIGKLASGLVNGNGWPLNQNESVEILTSGRVFGVVIGSAAPGATSTVAYWSERDF